MGFRNPPIQWSELESRLSQMSRPSATPSGADGGDSPAWSRERAPYRPDEPPSSPVSPLDAVPYAELHSHSTFSFLDGASPPEELVEEAVRLGLHGLSLTDRDGFYGIVRFAEAAAEYPRLRTGYGAELTLDLDRVPAGDADPPGEHLLLLARGAPGYHALAAALSRAQLHPEAEKGRPHYERDALAEELRGHVIALTGCRKGAVRRALEREGRSAARAELRALGERFGPDGVLVEITDHGDPTDSARNDALAELAAAEGLPVVATTAAHYARPERHRLASALAAVRARRSLDEMDGWLPAHASSFLRSGTEMAERFARYPGAVAQTVEVHNDTAFTLRAIRPGLPQLPVPAGHTPMTWLRELVAQGTERLYPNVSVSARERIARELDVIEAKDFPGYFLIVHDIVRFARSRGILCQGRGSAANSAVCYLLDITAVDSIRYGLPFERFLSSMREEEPDIDVDFDSDRREEVIQYVYATYGRFNAAQVANVITYRPKYAVRDIAKALGHSPGQQDAWSAQVERWGAVVQSDEHDIPAAVTELAGQLLGFPRHLGIHSGGMVLTDRPVSEVCAIEKARMPGRTVLQWDKDDCAWMGLVKFDLLGLGILAAIQHAFDLIAEHCGEHWELATLPKEEPAVYDMLCRADAIGVFQVESRAQLGLLPRLQPRCFYDLAIEIAMIRPGPIQGGAVHPFVRRKLGEEPIEYLHPDLEPVLARTLGVPVFQEQLMQMAMVVGGCTGEDADLLRRAMGSKRGIERIERLRDTLYAGMAEKGLVGETADRIYGTIQAFSSFGFAESHSISFALLVYASAWIKLHYPAAFLASLLRAQPMGFYSAQTLTADARRHGVETRRPDLHRSAVLTGLERADAVPDNTGGPGGPGNPGGPGRTGATASPHATGLDSCLDAEQPHPSTGFDRHEPDTSAEHRRDGGWAVRLGLAEISGLGRPAAARIVADRDRGGPFADVEDLARRVRLNARQLEALAASGAFDALGIDRRTGLWKAGTAARERPEHLAGTGVHVQPPLFDLAPDGETLVADIAATGISPRDHPLRHLRGRARLRGVLRADQLLQAESGRRLEVAGMVTHRQRPATASGITFMNIEDETGMINVICSVGVWTRYRRDARTAQAVVVRGILERSAEGVVNIVADRIEALTVGVSGRSRDFR